MSRKQPILDLPITQLQPTKLWCFLNSRQEMKNNVQLKTYVGEAVKGKNTDVEVPLICGMSKSS
jgi:hypothetical protein